MFSLNNNLRLAVTAGEPAGIGPDLLIQLLQYSWPVEIVVFACAELMQKRAQELQLPLILHNYSPESYHRHQASTMKIVNITTKVPVTTGQLNVANSQYVLNTLYAAGNKCIHGEFSALITGPVHKGIINEAGIAFTGHTEFFANLAGCNKVVMMLETKNMRVALATNHLAIKHVAAAITSNNLYDIIHIINNDLQKNFLVKQPHIYVCGLNPHCGENGYIGREEISVIIPALNKLRRQGLKITGPLPADSIFQSKYLNDADVILAMYHDQGLPVVKFQGFNRAINITLGLPFMRLSVDHGTALSLAGQRKANPHSFMLAIKKAIRISKKNHD